MTRTTALLLLVACLAVAAAPMLLPSLLGPGRQLHAAAATDGPAAPPLAAGIPAPAPAAPLVAALSAARPDEVDELNERAHAAIAEGRPGDAVTYLEAALAKAPDEAVLRTNLAYALFLRAKASLDELDFERAVADQRRAAELNEAEPLYKLHLGNTLLRIYRLDEARAALAAAVEQDGQSAEAHALLADALALADQLEPALAHYERAIELGDAEKAERARSAAERTRRQLAVERDYVTEPSTGFLLRHPPGGRYLELLSVLERARVEVEAELGLRASGRALVVLYPPDDFREVTGTHAWVGGLFDRKIRLPIGDVRAEGERIEAAFRHEFAHLLVSELAPRCPAFLNEGLAQFVEFGRGQGMARLVEWCDVHELDRQALPTVGELPESFLGLEDRASVSLGYRLSFAFVDHVAGHHGLAAVVRWIRESARAPVGEAYRAATGRPLADEEAIFRELLRTAR